MSFGALAFLNPWLLAALATLPIIYWLLRTVPPRPRQVTFPPTRILVGLENQEKTPAKSPWWLTLIRLLAAALIILALAEPVLNPSRDAALAGNGPGRDRRRQRLGVRRALGRAHAHDRPRHRGGRGPATAPSSSCRRPAPPRPSRRASRHRPKRAPPPPRSSPQPFAPDRLAAVGALETALAGAERAPASSGSATASTTTARRPKPRKRLKGADAGRHVRRHRGRPRRRGARRLRRHRPERQARSARCCAPPAAPRDGFVHAFSARGQRLGESAVPARPGRCPSTTVPLELPLELRNQVARVEIAGERSAGAVSLFDARSQWHRVALISGENLEQAQPLLAPLYYIEKALDAVLRAGQADGLQSRRRHPRCAGAERNRAHAGRHRHAFGRSQEARRGLGETRRRARALRRPAPRERRRRAAARAAARRRPHARRRAVVVDAAAARRRSRTRACSPACPSRRKSPSTARCWPTRPCSAPTFRCGRGCRTARRSSPRASSARARSSCSTSPPIPTGRTCRCRVCSSRCCAASPRSAPASPTAAGDSGAAAKHGRSGDAHGAAAAADARRLRHSAPPPPTAQPISAAKVHDLVPSLDHPPGYYGTGTSPRAINVLGPNSKLAPLPAAAAAGGASA